MQGELSSGNQDHNYGWALLSVSFILSISSETLDEMALFNVHYLFFFRRARDEGILLNFYEFFIF